MISESQNKKANDYLTQGRVCAVAITDTRAEFMVAGSGSKPYKVRWAGEWICTCPARVAICAHILACQKITTIEPARQLMFADDTDELTQYLNEALNR